MTAPANESASICWLIDRTSSDEPQRVAISRPDAEAIARREQRAPVGIPDDERILAGDAMERVRAELLVEVHEDLAESRVLPCGGSGST